MTEDERRRRRQVYEREKEAFDWGDINEPATKSAPDQEEGAPKVKAADYGSVGKDVQQTISSGGSGGDVAATGLTSMGVATANPALVAAGLGMGVLSASKKRKREREEAKYNAEIDRKKRVTDSLFRMSQSMGAMRL